MNIIWNALADLIQHLEWHTNNNNNNNDDNLMLQVAWLDVSTNALFLPGISAHWLPDVYYFGPNYTTGSSNDNGNKNKQQLLPVRYENQKKDTSASSSTTTHNHNIEEDPSVGGISDPVDILVWWWNVAEDGT